MRILFTGLAVFVIWCFVSAWLYNDKLLPVLNQSVTLLTSPENQSDAADSLNRLKANMPGVLTIYFEFDDTRFKADPQNDSSIAEIKAWLEKYPGSMVSVNGFTDIVGTDEFNKSLGLERAEAVAQYLEKKGIPSSRLIKGSMGESKAHESYITGEDRAKNRKTEVTIKMN